MWLSILPLFLWKLGSNSCMLCLTFPPICRTCVTKFKRKQRQDTVGMSRVHMPIPHWQKTPNMIERRRNTVAEHPCSTSTYWHKSNVEINWKLTILSHRLIPLFSKIDWMIRNLESWTLVS